MFIELAANCSSDCSRPAYSMYVSLIQNGSMAALLEDVFQHFFMLMLARGAVVWGGFPLVFRVEAVDLFLFQKDRGPNELQPATSIITRPMKSRYRSRNVRGFSVALPKTG